MYSENAPPQLRSQVANHARTLLAAETVYTLPAGDGCMKASMRAKYGKRMLALSVASMSRYALRG